MRIAKNGAVSLGSFYQFHPDDWQAVTRPAESEPINGGPTTEISESDIGLIREITSELEKFQNSLKCPNHSEVEKECKSCSTEFAKGRYLKYAIRRFHYIHREIEVEDQITDLMISLEAMLNREKYEVTDKTSQRAGFILEKEDRAKLECTKFLKNCYGIRSEIVHAKKRDEKLRKDVKQNDIILTDEQIKEKLEMYVRNAIQKILKLQNSYGSQQEILLKIDEASIDRSKSI